MINIRQLHNLKKADFIKQLESMPVHIVYVESNGSKVSYTDKVGKVVCKTRKEIVKALTFSEFKRSNSNALKAYTEQGAVLIKVNKEKHVYFVK